MEWNTIPQKTDLSKDEYRPRYLQQLTLIQELTGKNENDILETAKKNYMADWLLNYVSKYLNEDEQEVLSPRKFRTLVMVRGVYSYFLKRKLAYSFPQIGRRLGNRDHTTILGVLRKVEERSKNDQKFAEEVENLWSRAEKDFEAYVKKENKQIRQNETML